MVIAMNTIFFPFLLTTLAGLSTMIGSVFIFVKSKNRDRFITAALSFAAAVMITVSLTDLLPEAVHMLETKYRLIPMILMILICVNLGVIISFSIDKYLPDQTDGLYRIGLISMLAIMVHNIPEGMATFMAGSTDTRLGITLAIAIALHNIPEGISISIPIYYATGSKKKALLYTFISGISELFGAMITFLFLKPFISNSVLGFLFAMIAGIMGHIAFYELLPTSFKYKNRNVVWLFFIIGAILMIINHVLF